MGMDVYGRAPKSEAGKYFQANVWCWHPLAEMLRAFAPHIMQRIENLHSNDGDGLEAGPTKQLAHILEARIEDGSVKKYLAEYNRQLAEMPDEVCDYCKGTGIRTDAVGVEIGMPERETTLPDGTTRKGYCNYCQGEGKVRPFATHYGFDEETAQELCNFLKDCGGFEIC